MKISLKKNHSTLKFLTLKNLGYTAIIVPYVNIITCVNEFWVKFLGHESRTKHICSENFLVWLLPYKAIWKASWMDEILLCWILLTSWTFNMCSCEFKSLHVTIAIFNTGTYVQLLMAATTESATIAINCIQASCLSEKNNPPLLVMIWM